MNRPFLAIALAVVIAALALLGGVVRESHSAPATALAPPAAAAQLRAGFGAGDTRVLVSRLQREVRARPSASGYSLLGLAYEQRARETGDASYYSRAGGVFRRALELAPDDRDALIGIGSLALSRHEFGRALDLGRRALRQDPESARAYGVIGDALIELGRYQEAFAAFDRMTALKPNGSAYARVAYARELIGRTAQAEKAFELALDASAGQKEAYAWNAVQLGKLQWAQGRSGEAETAYRAALTVFPGYVYAFDALALVEAARGRPARAIALQRRAVDSVPLPQFVAQLADLLRSSGDRAGANDQLALYAVISKLQTANGVRTDLETALFQADHGIRLRDTLSLARSARALRPSVQGDDVLAWALVRNGRCGEALAASKRALRLGTRDALMFFHRAEIERCLGHAETARAWYRKALDLNPHFSLLWSPVARKAVA